LSLKQANEASVLAEGEVFDPSQYGMEARYDEHGNYVYPEGFDAEAQEWLPGYEQQQAEWERQYAEAQSRFEAHQAQIRAAREADAAAVAPSSYTSESDQRASAIDEEACVACGSSSAGSRGNSPTSPRRRAGTIGRRR
jgi:small subunit ribosomal protein S1